MPLTSRPQGLGSVNPTERLWTRWESNPGLKEILMHPLRACSVVQMLPSGHDRQNPQKVASRLSRIQAVEKTPNPKSRVFAGSSYSGHPC